MQRKQSSPLLLLQWFGHGTEGHGSGCDTNESKQTPESSAQTLDDET